MPGEARTEEAIVGIPRAWSQASSRLWAPWRRFWSWRRIRFTRGGLVFTAGTLAVGLAAINTGNNLLYLLLGAMLGFIALSSWLSEQVIGKISVRRAIPRGVTVGNPARIHYAIRNSRRRVPAFALEIGEEGLPGAAFLPFLEAGGQGSARSENRFQRRGVFPLPAITVSTSFPFGFFRKSLSLPLPAELVVWPRTDRPIRALAPTTAEGRGMGFSPGQRAATRGEYRGLRGYRPGDDPRNIHWRTTARLGEPVVREFERSDADVLWVCLDTRGRSGDRAESAVEMAASIVARAFRAGRPFGFATQGAILEPGDGPGHLEAVLDALARLDFREDAPRLVPPVDPGGCVLVSLGGAGGYPYADTLLPPTEASR